MTKGKKLTKENREVIQKFSDIVRYGRMYDKRTKSVIDRSIIDLLCMVNGEKLDKELVWRIKNYADISNGSWKNCSVKEVIDFLNHRIKMYTKINRNKNVSK